MRVRHEDIAEEQFESPKGRYGNAYRPLIRVEDTQCPFDLEHVVLPAGKANFPFHAHAAMWELYYVLAGTSTMRTDDETVELKAGDSYLCRPGLAHQIINESEGDFVYLVMSDEPPHDSCYYPDSGKLAPGWRNLWQGMNEEWRFWKRDEGAGYFDGEE